MPYRRSPEPPVPPPVELSAEFRSLRLYWGDAKPTFILAGLALLLTLGMTALVVGAGIHGHPVSDLGAILFGFLVWDGCLALVMTRQCQAYVELVEDGDRYRQRHGL